ncbi:MAG: hypothetical protein WCS55_02585 [Sulfuricurvum sp.]|uniref:hypothetical protein n=1 Tax=Sulfuricurvum sp. TaxID=2025608 RepID=UPI003568B0A6
MNQYEIEIKIKGKFPNSDLWQTIIAQWVQNNKDYLEENDFKDAAYWHDEMANISCLVGAIWKIGGVAISEYTINKNGGQNNNGRADLYFSINKTKYLVESKYIRKDTINSKEITTEMCCALKDCHSCNESGLDNKMAIVFAAPNDSNQPIDFNAEELDYDIKVMLKIIDNTKPKYNDKVYDTIYLFGQYFKSIDEECSKKKIKEQNALALLKLMAQSEEDIKNNRFDSQESFFEKIEQKLIQ